jgi:hypothetical protein
MFFLLSNVATTIAVLCLRIKGRNYILSNGRNVLLLYVHKTVIDLFCMNAESLIC